MADIGKAQFSTTSLRAYVMIGVMALIWLFFQYATAPGTQGWQWSWSLYDIVSQLWAHLYTFVSGIIAAIINLANYLYAAVFGGEPYYFSSWVSEGIFLKPRNLSNLMTQTAVTGILAVGMLMVIVSGNIDLSVGSVLGFAGGIAAFALSLNAAEDDIAKPARIILMVSVALLGFVYFVSRKIDAWTSILIGVGAISAYTLVMFGYSLQSALILAILVAVLIGTFQGTLTAYFKIPAFIVTLGGLLAWRGAVKWLLGGNTVPIQDEAFKAIGQRNLPIEAGWALAIVGIAFALFLAYRRVRSEATYGSGDTNYVSAFAKAAITIVGIVAFIFVMNAYQGVPIPVLIFVSVALIGVFLTTSTVFGRFLYAIGGNPEAARLSGIDNKLNVLRVYALLGAFTGIAAIIFTARVGSAAPDAGTLKELDAIAACVIGGASLMGGRGTVFGACIGALIMASLDNGMSLLNVRDFMQDIVKGSILVAAVGLDMMGRKQG
jgi:D-xylose transport system permease protein